MTKSTLTLGLSLFTLSIIIAICVTIKLSQPQEGIFVSSNFIATNGQSTPIYKVKTEDKKVALTFNAAWEGSDIPALLEKLKRHNVSLTFFIVGDFADKYPHCVKAISSYGHEIANHSNKHAHVAKMRFEDILIDLKECDIKLEALSGQKIKLYRAPYGEFNKNVISAVLKANHQCIQWDVDSRDWKNLSSDSIIENTISSIVPGSIVLFHTNKSNTFDAIDEIIIQLKSKGFEIMKVSDLLLENNYAVDSEGTQYAK